MDAMVLSSQKTSDIIGVIVGIPFPTNILALNVASEVARDIKGLITESESRVHKGSQQMRRTGQALGDVVSNAQEMSGLSDRFTQSACGQCLGIAAIHAASVVLDQSTQPSAAGIEVTSMFARNLRQQVERQTELLAVFRTGRQAQRGACAVGVTVKSTLQ